MLRGWGCESRQVIWAMLLGALKAAGFKEGRSGCSATDRATLHSLLWLYNT